MAKNRLLLVGLAVLAAQLFVLSTDLRGAELPGADALRAAIGDLQASFPDRYSRGAGYMARLDHLEKLAAKNPGGTAEDLQTQFEALKREALIANPLVNGRPILYVVRPQYLRDHHNTATMFQTGEINTASFRGGGAVKIVDFGRGGEVTALIEIPEGVARDPDIAFDGKTILFSMRRNRADDYHLYEMNRDGSQLRQLTFGSGVSDIDPIYLPDGRIMFTSTREPKFCMCNRHIMGNLFTMNGDGSNIQQIGHSTLHEGHPTLMPDGRVLYDRWEYVDRNFGDAQGVWTVNPDGTNHAVYWGNNTNSPGAVLDTRIIPDTERAVVTFSSCHDRPWGAIAIIDRRIGLDGRTPVIRTWPADAVDLVEVGNYDTFIKIKRKFEDPYPLSEIYFLASGMTGEGERTGIWLLDTFGNELLLHTDGPGCFDPLPAAAREKPPVIPSRVDLTKNHGSFYISNVYEGTGMERVSPGTVKYVRVVESPEKRYWTRQAYNGSGTQAPGMAWDDFNNKRIIGTAPVDPDGSAYFSVPADSFVYFQLLDEQGMMVQSMRSGTIVRPGETAGCVGCHDNRRGGVPPTEQRAATLRGPSRLEPWFGPTRNFAYTTEVQPVFDKHCVECHDYGTEGGKKLNLAGDLGLVFNTSYGELRSKGYVKVVGAGPFRTQLPKSWGSHASPLVKVLTEGHQDSTLDEQLELTPEEFDRIVTWIDINAPYYPDYGSAYRGNKYGRSPLNPGQLGELAKLTGVKFDDQAFSSHVSFTRPELSPCLAKFTDPADPSYRRALEIIRAGQSALASRPRADMPGFALVDPVEINQENKYQARLQTELDMRQSIVDGRKTFESGGAGKK
jgi:hydrazine synthase alpha subunit-like protein/WD40 repeat protein